MDSSTFTVSRSLGNPLGRHPDPRHDQTAGRGDVCRGTVPHVSVRTVWDDVTAELEELRRETEMQRADLMALENARLDQVFSKALSLFANGSVPAGRLAIATMGRRCLFVARYAANASYAGSLSVVSLSQGRLVSVISACLCF